MEGPILSISELISTLATSGDKECAAHIEAMFPESTFGLLMIGLPKAEPGQKLIVDGSGAVTMQFVLDPNGKKMIKACADPDTFDHNYPGCNNATMKGRQVLEMANKVPDADGVLICSATSSDSYPIYKTRASEVRNPVGMNRKWWQFWKRR